VCSFSFVIYCLRYVKYCLLSAPVELTVAQQKLFGVLNSGKLVSTVFNLLQLFVKMTNYCNSIHCYHHHFQVKRIEGFNKLYLTVVVIVCCVRVGVLCSSNTSLMSFRFSNSRHTLEQSLRVRATRSYTSNDKEEPKRSSTTQN